MKNETKPRGNVEPSEVGLRGKIGKDFIENLVSVIIPTYQSKWCVCDAIESVLTQNYRPIEIIVVDDGSTDGTFEFLQKKYENRILTIFQQNSGLAKARNTGLEIAKGEYVQFLDADDLLVKEKCFKQVKFLETNKQVSVVGSYYYEDDCIEGVFIQKVVAVPKKFSIKDLVFKNVVGPVHCLMIRRQALEKIGGFDETFHNYCADWELWLSMAILGFKFDIIEEPLAIYRRHSNSLTRTNILPNLRGDLNVTKRAFYYSQILYKRNEWEIYKALSMRYRRIAKEEKKSDYIPSFLRNCVISMFYSIISLDLRFFFHNLKEILKGKNEKTTKKH